MNILYLLLFLACFSVSANWSQLSPAVGNLELQTFAKCYAIFVREPLLISHPVVDQIQNSNKTGKEACIELINDINLGTNGELINPNPEKMKILKTFNDLHRDWFGDFSYTSVEGNMESSSLFDPQEPAYYYTRSLFQENKDIRDVLKGNKTLGAIRKKFINSAFIPLNLNNMEEGNSQKGEYPYNFKINNGNSSYLRNIQFGFKAKPRCMGENDPRDCNSFCSDDGTNEDYCDLSRLFSLPQYISASDSEKTLIVKQVSYDLINLENQTSLSSLSYDDVAETGYLFGIKEKSHILNEGTKINGSKDKNSHWFKYGKLQGPGCQINGLDVDVLNCLDRFDLSFDFDLFKTSGGGLIGSFPYQLVNSSDINNSGDGWGKVNRRWSSRLFKDVLCRNLPLIKLQDITELTGIDGATNFTNPPPFMNATSCIQCHYSMDFAARANRNTVFHPSVYVLDDDENQPQYMINQREQLNTPPQDEEMGFWSGIINDYGKTSPKGKLVMRNYHDTSDDQASIINLNVNGVQDFADKLLTTDDFYACVTSRYLKFLTGYEIDINDWPTTDQQTQVHRDFKRFSEELKTSTSEDQYSVKKLIEKIINSPYFMD